MPSTLRLIADLIVVIVKPLQTEGRTIGVATAAIVEVAVVVVVASGKHVKAQRLRWRLSPSQGELGIVVPASAVTVIHVREETDEILSLAVEEEVSGVVRNATHGMNGIHARVATDVTIGTVKTENQLIGV